MAVKTAKQEEKTMRKFFIATMFAFIAISLVAMTGCNKQPKITVTNETNTPTYAYQISHVSSTWETYSYYIIEFWGGTAEQRKTVATTPYYEKYSLLYGFEVSMAINDNVKTWERIMKQQRQ